MMWEVVTIVQVCLTSFMDDPYATQQVIFLLFFIPNVFNLKQLRNKMESGGSIKCLRNN